MKILLIEDNQTIALQIVEFLSSHHWQVDHANNAHLGTKLALEDIYDVILLDLNLPDKDGLEVCKLIKDNAAITPPIIMLTARDSFEDKSAGFKQGADDYLTKPFDLRELVLRCQALARRQSLHQAKKITLNKLTLNLTDNSVLNDGETLALTTIGFKILTLLVQAYPEPVSRSYITHKIWSDSPPDSDALKSHIYSLRKTLDKSFNRSVVKTVMNVGYKLEF